MSDFYKHVAGPEDLARAAWAKHQPYMEAQLVVRGSEEYAISSWTKLLAPLWAVVQAAQQSGQILIYRGIIVSRPGEIHWDNIGACWSYRENIASAMHPPKIKPRAKILHVKLHGWIKAEDVNWAQVLWQHVIYKDESEIRAEAGAIIHVVRLDVRESPRGIAAVYPFKREVRAKVDVTCDLWEPRK